MIVGFLLYPRLRALTGKISYSSIFLRRTNSRSLITFTFTKLLRAAVSFVAYSARVVRYVVRYVCYTMYWLAIISLQDKRAVTTIRANKRRLR